MIDPEHCKLIKEWTRHAIRDFTSPNIVRRLLGFIALHDHASLALQGAGKAIEEELTLHEIEFIEECRDVGEGLEDLLFGTLRDPGASEEEKKRAIREIEKDMERARRLIKDPRFFDLAKRFLGVSLTFPCAGSPRIGERLFKKELERLEKLLREKGVRARQTDYSLRKIDQKMRALIEEIE